MWPFLGERMRSRCTATTDTVCAPCQNEYFSTEYSHNFCKSCTICKTSKLVVQQSVLNRKLGGNRSVCVFLKGWCHTAYLLRKLSPKTFWVIVSIAGISWLIPMIEPSKGSGLTLPEIGVSRITAKLCSVFLRTVDRHWEINLRFLISFFSLV